MLIWYDKRRNCILNKENTDILEKILEARYIPVLIMIFYSNDTRTGKFLLHNDSIGGVGDQHHDSRDYVTVKLFEFFLNKRQRNRRHLLYDAVQCL